MSKRYNSDPDAGGFANEETMILVDWIFIDGANAQYVAQHKKWLLGLTPKQLRMTLSKTIYTGDQGLDFKKVNIREIRQYVLRGFKE